MSKIEEIKEARLPEIKKSLEAYGIKEYASRAPLR